jgi:hypothetical protein
MIHVTTVHVLHWEYIDKSASGITGVFDDEVMAKSLYDFAVLHADSKNFYLDTYELNEVKPQEK